MLSYLISRLVILLFGTLYPAYASYKAVKTKDIKEYVKWMMYWIVFAFFMAGEIFLDLFLSFWFPFYYEIKIMFVVWLLCPATKGSNFIYRKFVHPLLSKREKDIDEYIERCKEDGYSAVVKLGSKAVTVATNTFLETAVRQIPLSQWMVPSPQIMEMEQPPSGRSPIKASDMYIPSKNIRNLKKLSPLKHSTPIRDEFALSEDEFDYPMRAPTTDYNIDPIMTPQEDDEDWSPRPSRKKAQPKTRRPRSKTRTRKPKTTTVE